MKNSKLLKTNLIISCILVIGFALTAVLSYKANYQSSIKNIEQVSSLTTEGIYYQLTTTFTKPVNVSLTMSHDSLLAEHLMKEAEHLEDVEYVETTKNYLETYRDKYGFDSVFLVSSASGRYYNFDGVDRILTEGDPENVWYYTLMDSEQEYSLQVDNDEVAGADDEITVFVNCKIYDQQENILGIVGVGIRINYLKKMLREYEDKYQVEASLVSSDGTVEISTTYTGYEKRDWFDTSGHEGIRSRILGWKDDKTNLEVWATAGKESSYVVTRYIPELSWSLVVEQNTGQLIHDMKSQVYRTCLVLLAVVVTILFIITSVIRNFNKQITGLMEERQATFKRATEQLYDNIYELNITRNCCVGKRTEEYFASQGAKGLSCDNGIQAIAEKQIKEEFREGYISTFSHENVLHQYEQGNNQLRYDFMMTQDGTNYYWMRIDAYIFYSEEDACVHMFTYRRNIDAEKLKERQASIDEMTGFLNKRATGSHIGKQLSANPDTAYAFYMLDIDNFKQANDRFGHAFGDLCIKEFTGIIRKHFGEEDIFGRIGGDEFVVLAAMEDEAWAEKKAKELTRALTTVFKDNSSSWHMSASIGVACSPRDGNDFDTLCKNADAALYLVKQGGKCGYAFYSGRTV